MKPQTEEVEIEKYNIMLRPSLDSFLHSYNTLNISLWDCFIKLFISLDNLFSFDFISKIQESLAIKKINNKNKKEKEAQIKKLTRSYKTSFNRFNNESTYYETDENGLRRREDIRLQKNRII